MHNKENNYEKTEVSISIAKRFLRDDDIDEKVNMVAVCFKGSTVVSYGHNKSKTDPAMKEIVDKYNIKKMYEHSKDEYVSFNSHAELEAIKSANSDFDTIVILRITKQGDLVNARPCNICQKLLEEREIKNVFYSEDNVLRRFLMTNDA